MKNLIALVLLATTLTTQAVTVKSARLDATKANLLVDIAYGGCGTPKFKLTVGGCLESLPAQCGAKISQIAGFDLCERLNMSTATFNLAANGLTGDYFKNALLTLSGDKDPSTGKASSATVRLP